MKWCFLLNSVDYLIEFLAKISCQVIREGDECIAVANSKIIEYSKIKYFPKDVKILSRVDWCIKNYNKNRQEYEDLSWKEFFPDFDRNRALKLDYNNSVGIISQLYQFFEDILKKERPDVVINEAPANVFTEIAYHFCKKYNIVYLGFIGSKFERRADIYWENFKELNNNISEQEREFAKEFLEKFVSHQQLPSYMNYQQQNFRLSKINRLKRFIKRRKQIFLPQFKYFLNRKYYKPYDYESETMLKYNSLWHFWDGLKWRTRAFLQKNIYDSWNNNEIFFFFPLHLQPEASTSVFATYFCDQLNSIKNIAFTLPFPYKLFVKEHPAALGTRSKDFYKKLKQIPNVVLISPYESVENLIKKSQGVITLTSTIGLEAALTGKPVYVLGDVFYSHHPLCQKVKSFEELKEKIKTDLIEKPLFKNLEDINLGFITSYFRNTIPCNIADAVSKNDLNDYEAIYEKLKKIYLKRKNGN